jgi:ABC-2 type transport system permease protein
MVRRYLKTLRLFWSAAVAAEMEYRLNFVLATITSLGNLVGSLFGLSLFYANGTTLGGWRWEEAMIVLGLAVFLDGFSSTFLRPNLGQIVEHVRSGTLDFVLLKPIDPQFWLSSRNLSIWGIPNLAYGLAVIGYGGTRLGLTPGHYAAGVWPLAMAVLLLYSLWFMLSTTSLWFVKIHNVTNLLSGLLEAGRFPVPAYPALYRVVLTFIVPVALLTTVPASAVLRRPWGVPWLSALLLAVGLAVLSRAFWRFGLRRYTSASS